MLRPDGSACMPTITGAPKRNNFVTSPRQNTPPRGQLRLKLFALSLGVLMAFALIETLPRLLPGLMPAKVRSVVRIYDARASWERMMQPDAQLGFSLRPGLDLKFPSEGREIGIRTTSLGINNLGFRDIGTSAPFEAVALGDSFTFCDDSPAEACWVKLLSDRTGLSIATLGVNGYSNLAEARLLAKVGEHLKPRLVLAGFFPNDFKDNLHFDNWTRSGTDDYWTWMRRQRRSDASDLLARYSVTYRLIDAARRYGRRDTYRHREGGLDFMFRADAWWRKVVENPGGTKGFGLMRKALRDMKEQAASLDAELVVLLFPFKEQVYWHIAQQYQPEGHVYTREQIEAPLAAVREFCDQEGLRCCDLTDALTARALQGKQLYLPVGAHWNDLGNAVVAEETQRCLSELSLVEAGAATDGVPGSRDI